MKLLIADDHHVVRKGLVYFLEASSEFEQIIEASNGEEAVAMYKQWRPDVVLMDIDMPIMNGIEATQALIKEFPDARVLILTSFSDQDHVIPALRAGACGYQLKDVEPETLVGTIKAAQAGEHAIHPQVMKHVLTHVAKPEDTSQQRLNQLTEREKEVLQEISTGKSNKEIAATLIISEKTVKTHVSNLLSKLELQDRTQAALFAIQVGIAKPTVI